MSTHQAHEMSSKSAYRFDKNVIEDFMSIYQSEYGMLMCMH